MNMNVVILGGRLTRDIELKTLTGGTVVANIGFACNRRIKRGEEWVEEPVFIDVTMFGKRAEALASRLRKGDPVIFEGELGMDQWEDKNGGGKRTKIKLVAESFHFVGSRPAGNVPEQRVSGGGGETAADDTPF